VSSQELGALTCPPTSGIVYMSGLVKRHEQVTARIQGEKERKGEKN